MVDKALSSLTAGSSDTGDYLYGVVGANSRKVQVGTLFNSSSLFIQAGTGAVARTFLSKARDIVHVADFGAVGNGTTNDTAAIQAAIDYIDSVGGGTVVFGRGTYLVSNLESPAASWDNDVALWIIDDNVHLRGQGRGATIIRLANSADCHVIKFGQRISATVTVSDCSVSDLTIDGNRANQSAPTAAEDHWNGIDVATGCSRIILDRLHIHDTQHYGIGFQSGTFEDCRVSDVLIENTGADGIDCKNDSALNFGNVISGAVVRAFGLAGGLSTDQAGLDIYGGFELSNIHVLDYGATQGKCGIRYQSDDGAFAQSEPPKLTNFYCESNDSADTMGLRVNDHNGSIANGYVKNCSTGVQVNQRENTLVNITVEDGSNNGFVFTSFGGITASRPDRNMVVGCFARGNTGSGFLIAAGEAENVFVGCIGRSNAVGVTVTAGATSNKFVGCNFITNTTPISDGGTDTEGLNNHYVRNAAGQLGVLISAGGTIANRLRVNASSAGTAIGLVAEGSDTNIDVEIEGKGTGGANIKGTGTNDNAAAGDVGEFVESTVLVASAVALTTNTSADVTSISLTAGDWDVFGGIWYNPAATTSITVHQGGASGTSATLSTAPGNGAQYKAVQAATVPNATFGQPIGTRRISVSSTTTIYLVTQATFTVSTLAAFGFIGARRIR